MFQEINDYALLKLLGKGTFGEVHLAESVDKDQYALKIIPVTKENKAQAKKQAQMYVSFEHPNIVKAREFFFFKKQQYLIIILEYCPDGHLLNLIGKIDQSKCIEIMKQIAQGLIYLHDEKKTLHRDIKLENILMLNGIPKIADLGIAKIMKTSGLQTKAGTLFYASPEVLNQENYDFSADIWSLGIVFLELLLGKRITNLVKGMNPPALRKDFPSDELLDQIKDQIMRELVKKMLQKDPQMRFKVKQVLEKLKEYKVQDSDPDKNSGIDQRESFRKMSETQFINLLIEDTLFPYLTHFYLEGSSITDKALKRLSTIPSLKEKFPNLKDIKLSKNQITDEGLKAFVGAADQLQNLQSIDLSNNQITDEGLKALACAAGNLKNLQGIYLDNNQITDEGLKILVSSGDQLRYLWSISLRNNRITDEGLKAVDDAAGQLKNLHIIDLSSNKITIEGLKVLAGAAGKLANLQSVYLHNTKVTNKAADLVKQQYKNNFIIFCD